jgi:dGTP triphosphohydrolase
MPTYQEIRDDFERGVRTAEQRIEHPFHHAADAATQTPAQQPAKMAAATAVAATQQGDTMSLATIEADLGNGVAAVENEFARFKQNLPAIVAEAKNLASNPLAQVAIQAGEHFAAGILPPEALAVLASNSAKLLNDLLGLYNPAPQASTAPAQQPQQPVPAPQ